MELLKEKVLRCLPEWNKRIYTEIDAYEYCETKLIGTIETNLIKDLGEYRMHRGLPMILIHKFASANHRSWILWHEIGHDIFHTPLSCKFSPTFRSIIEKEANIVAAVALIPLPLMKKKKFHEIHEEFNYPKKLIELRKSIFDNYKF